MQKAGKKTQRLMGKEFFSGSLMAYAVENLNPLIYAHFSLY
jgi:hypothetical protein